MGLCEIRNSLKAPKGQYNNFGKYAYRSCEDILEAVKPLLGECTLLLTDEIVMLGTRYYVKATARFVEGDKAIEVYAYAREEDTKKGMDASQITGSASSYARKYALNGLFLIDDNKDADSEKPKEDKPKSAPKANAAPKAQEEKPSDVISDAQRVRLQTMASKAKYSTDLMKQIITACGYASSRDIKEKHYQTLCEFIEGTPVEQAPAGIAYLSKWCKEN